MDEPALTNQSQWAAERPQEGSQGQAKSEAERAAPGNARNKGPSPERATEMASSPREFLTRSNKLKLTIDFDERRVGD
jgi:hypothetical protein